MNSSLVLIRKIILCVCFVFLGVVSAVSYGAENSNRESLSKKVLDEFGVESVKRFEKMFKTEKFDFDYFSYHGGNVLHYAAMTGNLNRVKQLVEQGADIHVKNKMTDRTVLIYAAESDNLELVKWLVEHGADVKEKIQYGETVLMNAAGNGNLEMVKWLIEHGANVKEKDNVYNMSILHLAAGSGNLELVKWLIEHGADINAKGRHSNTVLHLAADSGNLELVK